MSTRDSGSSTELTPQETAALLQRILQAVEQDRRKRWVEITCAVVLSLATTASAWSAYQSTLWGGVQTFRLAAAGKAGREASEATLASLQMRAFDASMFISYLEAKNGGNAEMEKLLYDRFRPEMKTALNAWLKTDPFQNPAAPLTPFKMAEYVQPEQAAARRQDELAGQMLDGAQQANQTSDTYVLFTVLFASVLFFGGIGGTFESQRLRKCFFVISLMLFVFTVTSLWSLPICTE